MARLALPEEQVCEAVCFTRNRFGKKGYELTMEADHIQEIEEKIADLKARWPAHSVPPSMWQQLEELEEALEKAKRERSANAK